MRPNRSEGNTGDGNGIEAIHEREETNQSHVPPRQKKDHTILTYRSNSNGRRVGSVTSNSSEYGENMRLEGRVAGEDREGYLLQVREEVEIHEMGVG